ncbi:PaaI family thioesterase [Paracoccaceae bacterium GXU_MW_L88]
MDKQEIQALMREVFPQIGEGWEITHQDDEKLTLRLAVSDSHLRPGGTVSGPTMFALADLAMYFAILSKIGPKLLSVTTGLNINFMRKPTGPAIYGDARILKMGKSLAVGDVTIYNEGEDAPVAHAQVTYSIPKD